MGRKAKKELKGEWAAATKAERRLECSGEVVSRKSSSQAKGRQAEDRPYKITPTKLASGTSRSSGSG
jgi:hypothetical protein